MAFQECVNEVLYLAFRLLVGAPLGTNLQPGTNHSGALYKCPLTTNHSDCEQVITDGKRSKFMFFTFSFALMQNNVKIQNKLLHHILNVSHFSRFLNYQVRVMCFL